MNYEFILLLESLTECICLKYHIHSSQRRVALGSWKVFFPVLEELVCSFNILFDIFWNSIRLTYVTQFGLDNLVHNCLFTSQRILFYSRYEFFIIPSLILWELESSRIELAKLILNILVENWDRSICPGWSILFLWP